jgi:carbon storage regulator CsrA
MLVLSRKVGEVVAGENTHITVVAVHGEKVLIGIGARGEVVVDRQNVHEARTNSFQEGPGIAHEGGQAGLNRGGNVNRPLS